MSFLFTAKAQNKVPKTQSQTSQPPKTTVKSDTTRLKKKATNTNLKQNTTVKKTNTTQKQAAKTNKVTGTNPKTSVPVKTTTKTNVPVKSTPKSGVTTNKTTITTKTSTSKTKPTTKSKTSGKAAKDEKPKNEPPITELKGKTPLKDSTLYNIMHYHLPDSTKIFFNQMVHPETRDSIYYQETDIVDLFIYTFSSKKPNAPKAKPRKKGRIYWSFFPTANPAAKDAIVTSTNLAFYLGSTKTTKLSNFNFLAFYNFSNQFTFPVRGNVWTANNNYNLQSDFRFYYYPVPTYGLGADTKLSDKDLITYNYTRLHQSVLRKVNERMFAGVGYAYDYHGNIHDQNPNSQGGKDFIGYGTGTRGSSLSSGITLNALYDDRNNSINPEKGHYFNVVLRLNWKFLGSDNNWQSLYLDARKYISISKTKNQIFCFWGLAWFTVSGNPPYLDLPSTGWDVYSSTGRGYSQGRFTGKNMLYFETEYRFNLMKNGLLGGVLFSNASAFPTSITNLNMRILPALGAGLRVKINKNSRTNFAFDYAHGLENSWGLWLTIGEVF